MDLASVTPTGPKGHATKQDVRDAADRVSAPAPSAEYDLLPVTGMRRSIATALVHAKQNIPHFYLTSDVTMDALLALREQLNARPRAPSWPSAPHGARRGRRRMAASPSPR